MTHTTETDKKKGAVMQAARNQMTEWRQALQKLEEDIHELPTETRAEYEQKLSMLKLHWQQVESKFTAISQTDPTRQGTAYTHWRETAVAYDEAFLNTTHELKATELVPLGWLQGFTDKRIQDSEGWAEGFGKRPAGSEGFAEGMGHKDKVGSRGWAEGYDKVSQS